MFNPEHVAIANKTSRNSKAIGSKAITPKYVRKYVDENNIKDGINILDYGAGKAAAHARALLNDGYCCTAYEFGDNIDKRYHDPLALEHKYDIVFASNVLNVQSDVDMLRKSLKQIHSVTCAGGVFIANYPLSPRKTTLSVDEMVEILQEFFRTIKRVGGSVSAPLWECSDKHFD